MPSSWRFMCGCLMGCLNFHINFQLMTSVWAEQSHDFYFFFFFFVFLLLQFSRLELTASLELMKKCFQHQFLILLSVICYIAESVLCSFARALFNPFNVHPSFVMFLITASHNIHSCNALLSFFIIYKHKKNVHNNMKSETKMKWSFWSVKRKVFSSSLL